ncbi:FAD-dependent oxidoreductase [Rhizorhabdus argentea]|uniref:FAD-dependent oxidoreductase n=1 Tax=Rhizorhabdus argentea TaxID=1387174 RepID=UPI0030EDF358
MTDNWDERYDAVVVGSGAAGLTAAIIGARRGMKMLVIEKAAVWGGTSAWSGGGVWAPANRLQKAAGIKDSVEEAAKFLDEVVTDEGLATSPERRMAYLRGAPEMVDVLIEEGMGWTADRKHPDYLSDRKHAGIGRDLDSQFFDAKRLGAWRKTMRRGPAPYAIRLKDIQGIAQGISSVRSLSRMAFIFFRQKLMTALGQDPVGCGESLVAQLMAIAQRRGVEFRLNTPLVELVSDEGGITGVVTGGEAGQRRIGARAGVLLSAGGFAHGAYREKVMGMTGRWSSASPDDTGDIVQMAMGIGAMTSMLDEAWWGSAFVYPGDVPVFCQWERSLPFSIVVDSAGKRFCDEAEDYYSFGQSLIAHGIDQAWLIMDARHRKRYTFGGFFPGHTPKAMFEHDFFRTADTLDGIAEVCGIDPAGLRATVARFNTFVDKGVDEDFRRGGEPYDRYWGDPTIKPNPNLGKIEQGPFLATRVYLGDLGTKGGYVTDADAQVLNLEGHPIEGLYAAGNSTASVMGRSYPGPGVTLGPAMTFGYLAMEHAARRMANRPITA